MKKAALHNLGCKVNAYEMDAMREMLEGAGYEIVPFREGADVYIINTCTVTNIADRKSRQMLHRARKMNPEAVVVAAGCYVQAQEQEKHPADPCIDIIIGNNRKKELLQILDAYEREKAGTQTRESEQDQQNGGTPENGGSENTERENGEHVPAKYIEDLHGESAYEELHLTRAGEHTRAYIKVQDGCNQFCSYCIIPFARGRVRSREPEHVLEEVRHLSENGYREVVLTGIHLSSYGMDFRKQTEERQNRYDGKELLKLIRAVHEAEGIFRIRLGSLEPRIITEEFVQGISELPKLCPHFHLSLQSGCDATLRRMNRHYTNAQYEESCRLLRKYFQNPALTTDVIVGFPGETEAEFEESYAFVDRMDFYETHIFKYSRREGTRAAVMEQQIPEEVKNRRSSRMIALGEKKQKQYERSFLGKEVEVLVEETIEQNGKKYPVGHTREYLKVLLEEENAKQNSIQTVQIQKDSQIIH